MKLKTTLLLLLALSILLTVSAYAIDENWKLAIWDAGFVENQYSGGRDWHRIWQSRMLKDGDLLRTLDKSRARIKLADQTIITLGQNTQVEMSQFKMTDNSRTSKIKLITGKVRSKIVNFFGKKSNYEVETPNGVLAARGTDFLVEHLKTGTGLRGSQEEDETRLMVFSSAVDITAGGKTTTVSAGNTAIIGPNGIVTINPPSFTFQQSLETRNTPDADMYDRSSGPAESSERRIPSDPMNSATAGGTQPGSSPDLQQQPGGVQPPPSHTGTVIINITPQ